MNDFRIKRLAVLLVLMLMLVLPVALRVNSPAEAFAQGARPQSTVTVAGGKKIFKTADVAHISLTATTFNADILTAQKDNVAALDRLTQKLTALNIGKKDMVTASYNMYPQYDYKAGSSLLTGYNVSNSVRVRVTDFSLLGRIIDAAGAAGISNIGGIEFSLADPTAAYNEALAGAILSARKKADILAAAGGSKIKSVVEIKEVEGFNHANHTLFKAAETGGDTTINAGEIAISASVSVVYLLA